MNPMLYIDFYKSTHSKMYHKDIAKIVSYFTPRGTRLGKIETENELVMFGLQGFIKEFLIEQLNEGFFGRPKSEVIGEYRRILDSTIGEKAYDISKIEALHDLGYLPVKISAVAEGTRVPVKVPMIQLENTHPDFAWCVEYIESLILAESWHAMTCANVGYRYRQAVNKYYDISVEDNVERARAIGDFSFRGQESLSAAIKTSAAFCLSFLNTATVPAIPYLEKYYNCDCTKEPVAFGAVSTEHSVMCSSFALDGDEITMVKRLLNEIYPDTSFSMVSDSYDYWNLVDNIIPACKEDILRHNGTLLIRGDSGDPVEIVTETVFRLWNTFGGTVNSKGYKVLDPHVKAIYGDSITPERMTEIYEILIKNGFACNNVSLGVGAFSMQCAIYEGGLAPFTRDTFQCAVKATYCEDRSGNSYQVYKAPKTDSDNVKKSQKGMCCVYRDEQGVIAYKDGYTSETIKECADINLLEPVFENGRMIKEYSLSEIRNRLHNNSF